MNGNSIKSSNRSLSQRSIYDYPEHLNPFYEAENHKRLRFWKFGSDKPNRSNSFSIDGFKALWSFKTSKLKKKSSSLGINKTSESPPMLRRDDDRYGSQKTFDGRMRHTVDIGLGNNFQRGTPCRSSLQDLNSISRNQAEKFFIRNNRYRNTMAGTSALQQHEQAHSNAALSSGTSCSRIRYNQQSISRGSSQLSVNSTNPFDDGNETISQIGSPGPSSIRHSARKKRRAPPPPVLSNLNNCYTLEHKSDFYADHTEEDLNITNLAAEIHSFVRTAGTDKEDIESRSYEATAIEIEGHNNKTIEINNEEHNKSRTSRQSPERNDHYPLQDVCCEKISIEKIQNLGRMDINCDDRSKKSPIKILIRAATVEEPISTTIENDDIVTDDTKTEIIIVEQTGVEKSGKNDTKVNISVTNEVQEEIKDSSKGIEGFETVEVPEDTEETTTPTSSAVEFELEHEDANTSNVATVLKITESIDDLTKTDTENSAQNPTNEFECEFNDNHNYSVNESSSSFSGAEISSIPLKLESSKAKNKGLNAVFGAKRGPPTPQRRRSVKEIIESINKCQSLLKVNQDLKTDKAEKKDNDLFQASSSSMESFKSSSSIVDRNMNDLAEKQYQSKKMLSDITEDMSNIPLFVEKFNEFNNNNPNSMYEKSIHCGNKIFSNEKVSNVEWNPVPKPRRHRNSTHSSNN